MKNSLLFLIVFFLFSCSKSKKNTPKVETIQVESVSLFTAKLQGHLSESGHSDNCSVGFCWSTIPNPILSPECNQTYAQPTNGYFSFEINGLIPNVTYYFRAFAKNEKVTAYGDQIIFTTLPRPESGIGSLAHGGVIAYILQPDDFGYDPNIEHGLVASFVKNYASPPFTNVNYLSSAAETTTITDTLLGTGNLNTINIVNACGNSTYAAKICNDLESNGYSDWYLPSKQELHKLYENKDLIGGFRRGLGKEFDSDFYVSSSVVISNNIWVQNFHIDDSNQIYEMLTFLNTITFNVRPIRSF